MLAEAGTGTGKTLGYIAPASLWAEKNGAPVWISTFTRNLQRQIDQETARLYPDPEERRRRVVVRKGRENYLCLLNLEDQTLGRPAALTAPSPLGLVARWALATRDGDMMGGDFPGWLTDLFGPGAVWPLADRRGECIHSACPHYSTCFVEQSIRRAQPRTHRHRQPRAGDDPGGARRRRGRSARCASSSTRATTCSTPPTAPSPPT